MQAYLTVIDYNTLKINPQENFVGACTVDQSCPINAGDYATLRPIGKIYCYILHKHPALLDFLCLLGLDLAIPFEL